MKTKFINRKHLFGLAGGITLLATVLFLKNSIAIADPQIPDLTTLVPVSGAESGGNEVTLFGTRLSNPTVITFGGNPAEIVASTDNEVLVIVPTHEPGVVDVYYENSNGNDTLPLAYTYEEESVDDFACKSKGKQLVCHLPEKNNEKAINLCLPEAAVRAHIAHGDYMGLCTESDRKAGNVKNDGKSKK